MSDARVASLRSDSQRDEITLMKEISIEELKRDAARWVRLAARKEPVIIIDGGKPVATLIGLEPPQPSKRLPYREDKIRLRSQINVDSADYLSEMRD